jgi:hypothetical protein
MKQEGSKTPERSICRMPSKSRYCQVLCKRREQTFVCVVAIAVLFLVDAPTDDIRNNS